MTKTPQELADFLKNYNRWRRSDTDQPMPDPTELGEAIDQVIAILEEQAQPQSLALSDCCEARVVVEGKPGSTQWYTCSKCRNLCNVFYQHNTPQS